MCRMEGTEVAVFLGDSLDNKCDGKVAFTVNVIAETATVTMEQTFSSLFFSGLSS
jgi:hypothetical protein